MKLNADAGSLPHDDWLAVAARYDADFNPTLPPIVMERGEGVMLTDTEGHQTIDMSDLIAHIGHCHPRHVAAVQQAAAQMIISKGNLTNPSRARLVQRLAGLTPSNLDKVFLATSGSEICEWAIRIARRATGRHEILSFWGGLHGRTYGAMSMNGSQRRKRRFGPLMPGCLYAPYPYCYRCPFDKRVESCNFYCLGYLDRAIEAEGTGDLAALIVEACQGFAGIVFAPEGYLPRLQQWAAEQDVVFILDEVQTSFGRTGRMFALEWEGLRPNILCVGKGLGGGLPMAALVAEAGLLASVAPGELSGGIGGNPLGCSAALAVLDILEEENLADHAARVGAYLLGRFRRWQDKFAFIGDVRGRGLCLALEFVRDRESKEPLPGVVRRLSDICYPRGVYLSGGGHILSIRPPLILTEDQAEWAADVIEGALAEL
jgi:4-aminobutyrate aminotransferase-like enzyme